MKILISGVAPRLGTAEGRNWLVMTTVLWLGSPLVSDTVVMTTGTTGYLWPAAAGLAMLCLFLKARDRLPCSQVLLQSSGISRSQRRASANR